MHRMINLAGGQLANASIEKKPFDTYFRTVEPEQVERRPKVGWTGRHKLIPIALVMEGMLAGSTFPMTSDKKQLESYRYYDH